MIKLTQKDVEALQREWDIQDNSRARERQVIQDKLFHDKPKQETEQTERSTKVENQLEEGKWLKELEGKLLDDPIQKDVDTRNGPANVANFRMSTEHGEVKIGLWNEQADYIMNYTEGARIILTNLQVKEPYDGVHQLSGSRNTKIKEAKP